MIRKKSHKRVLNFLQNVEKCVIHVVYLLKNMDKNFSIVLCVKNSSNGAEFFTFL